MIRVFQAFERRQEHAVRKSSVESSGRTLRFLVPAEPRQRLDPQGLALFDQGAVPEPADVLRDDRQRTREITARDILARVTQELGAMARSAAFAAGNVRSMVMDVVCPCCGQPLFDFG